MKKEVSEFLSTNNNIKLKKLEYYPNDMKVKGVLHFMHGMLEYIEKYEEFFEFMTNRGFYVVAYDMLGHGEYALKNDSLGFIASENGDKYLVDDVHKLYEETRKKFPNEKYFFLGHSMGSFILRNTFTKYDDIKTDGIIIMGTGTVAKPVLKFGTMVANNLKKKHGEKYKSKRLAELGFLNYNSKIKDLETDIDWITSDKKKIKEFKNNPLCNFTFTVSAYRDLYALLLNLANDKNFEKWDRNYNILLISGTEDPVGSYGKAVTKIYENYKKNGFKNVELKLYDDLRHELLSEVSRNEVYNDIYNWIDKH